MSHERTFTFSMVNGMLSITHPDHPGETQVPIRTTMTEAKKEAIKVFLADHYVSMVEPNFRKPLDLLDPAGAQYPDYVDVGPSMDFRDDTWMDGKLCRYDYPLATQKGQEILVQIHDEFPDVKIDEDNPLTLVTDYDSERYANRLFSSYTWSLVPQSIMDEYNISDEMQEFLKDDTTPIMGESIMHLDPSNHCIGDSALWFGQKMDRVTKDVFLKPVMPETALDSEQLEKMKALLPDFYTFNRFCAMTFSKDGTADKNIDWYFTTLPWVMEAFCADNGLEDPCPIGWEGQEPTGSGVMDGAPRNMKLMCYGLVWNTDEEKFKHAKAYFRQYN